MRNKIIFGLSLVLLIFVFVSCSSVFEGGLSGTLTDINGVGISGVRVYAYTDKKLRDQDFNRGTSTDSAGRLIYTPSYDGNNIPTTTTDAGGNFTISKLVWKTTKPEFGKSADLLDVYLLYFHPDYGLVKEQEYVTIVSDSNNSSRVSTQLERLTDTKNVTLNLVDVAMIINDDLNLRKDGALVTESVPVTIKGYNLKDDGTAYERPFVEYDYDVSASTNITLVYKKDEAKKVKYTIEVTPNESSYYKLVNQTIDPDTDKATYMYAGTSSVVTLDDATIRGYENSTNINIPFKSYFYVLYPYSGQALANPSPTSIENDGVSVWLARMVDEGKVRTVSNVETTHQGSGESGSFVLYGLFSNLGDDVVISVPLTFADAIYTESLYVIVDKKGVTGEGIADIGDYFYKIDFKSDGSNVYSLGQMTVANQKLNTAASYSIIAVN